MTNDKAALRARDDYFRQRLAAKDESVLHEIDRDYRPALYCLLRRFLGPRLAKDSCDSVANHVLYDLWSRFDRNRGSSVRAFYFQIAKRHVQDMLRKRAREESSLYRLAGPDLSRDATPDVAAALSESVALNKKAEQRVSEAVLTLSTNQRTAFRRSAAAGDGEYWAASLESETGRSAKKWRKDASIARARIRSLLTKQGLRYSEEGGHYEIASAVGPA